MVARPCARDPVPTDAFCGRPLTILWPRIDLSGTNVKVGPSKRLQSTSDQENCDHLNLSQISLRSDTLALSKSWEFPYAVQNIVSSHRAPRAARVVHPLACRRLHNNGTADSKACPAW